MKHEPVFTFVLITIICFSAATALFGLNPPMLIMGDGLMDSDELYSFFMENNPDAEEERVSRLAGLYIEECVFEGVNSDVAFVQMCLETGFLRFTGLVSSDMNNFCGLGSVGPGQPGHSFVDERIGVRGLKTREINLSGRLVVDIIDATGKKRAEGHIALQP